MLLRCAILFALLVSPNPSFGQDTAIAETIAFVRSLQNADGGYRAESAAGKSTLRATSAAVRTLKYLGAVPERLDATTKFVESCAQPTGGFGDVPGAVPNVTITAVGLMARKALDSKVNAEPSIQFLLKYAEQFEERRMAIAGMETVGLFPKKTAEWLDDIQRTRTARMTFGEGDGEVRATGGTIAMFLRSGTAIPDEQRKAVSALLTAGQRSDGGYGREGTKVGDLETTYRVARSLHLLKVAPKRPADLQKFLDGHRNKDGGYGVEPGKASMISATYYVHSVRQWFPK